MPPATHHSSGHHNANTAPPVPTQLAHFVIFNPTLIPPKSRKRNKDVKDELQKQRSPDQPSSSSVSAHVTTSTDETATPAIAGDDGKPGEEGLDSKQSLQTPEDGSAAEEAALGDHDDAGRRPSKKEEDNPDLEDDLREAAQILFYTSHQAGGVSRDVMLRQVGLAKGLMGFTSMAAPSDAETGQTFWAVHGMQTRMIVYSPLPDWYIYICIKGGEAGVNALSDQLLVDGLERGYHDFCLLHDAFDKHEPGHAFVDALERFFTRFTLAFEKAYLSPPSLLTWLGGQPPSDPALAEKLSALPPPAGSTAGLLTRSQDGAVVLRASVGAKLDPPVLDALVRYLAPSVTPPPAPPREEKKTERAALGFGFGRRRPSKDLNKEGWAPLAWVGLSAPSSRSATPTKHIAKAPSGGKRWFGDLGGVFGLGGSKPGSPSPEAQKGDSGKKDSETAGDTGGKDDKDETAAADAKPTDTAAGDDCAVSDEGHAVSVPKASEDEPGPGPMLAVSATDSVAASALDSALSSEVGSVPSESTIPSRLPTAHASPSVATDTTEVTATVDPSIHASESTTLVDDTADTASIRTTRSTPSMIAKEPPGLAIQDALASEPDPWTKRTVYVPQRATVRWVVRNGAMVFVLQPDADADAEAASQTETDAEPAESNTAEEDKDSGAQRLEIERSALNAVFTALEPAQPVDEKEKEKEKGEKLPLGIYHDEAGGVTKVRPVPNAEGVALANLREIGTATAFGQLPSGRFVVRKAEGGTELFVQTPRQGGITEAERILRQWSYACEAI